MNWDEYFLNLVEAVATKSKDPSAHIGCVIVGPDREVRSTGFNGFPRGCYDRDPARYERPIKYIFTEHAERNAVYNAARNGIALKDSTMYSTGPPCSACARAIIQTGIKRLVYPEDNPFVGREDWKEDMKLAALMLLEGGVQVNVL